MLKPELIITDLDQTLLRTDKTISAFTIDTLNQCRKIGAKIGIATARSEEAAKKYIDQIKPDIILSNGGAQISVDSKTIYKCLMSAETSDALICKFLTTPGVGDITVATENSFFWNSMSFANTADYLHAIYNDFKVPLNCKTYKLTVQINSKETANQIASEYDECRMMSFTGEDWYRFAHKNATKLFALKYLSNYINISMTNIMSFGDDYNDIEMIEHSGYGIAVANAIHELKEKAKFITRSNDEDGVAHYLKTNLLINSKS